MITRKFQTTVLLLIFSVARPALANDWIQCVTDWLGPDVEVTPGSPLLCTAFMNKPSILGGTNLWETFAKGRITGPKNSLKYVDTLWGWSTWRDELKTGRLEDSLIFYIKADASGTTTLKMAINGQERKIVLRYKVVDPKALMADKKDWIEARSAVLRTYRVDKPLVVETWTEKFRYSTERKMLTRGTLCFVEPASPMRGSITRGVKGKTGEQESAVFWGIRPPLSKLEAFWEQRDLNSARPIGRLGGHVIWLQGKMKRGIASYWAVSPEKRMSRSVELFKGSDLKDTQYLKWAVMDGYERPSEWWEWRFGSYARNSRFAEHSISRWHLGPVPAKAQEIWETSMAERKAYEAARAQKN